MMRQGEDGPTTEPFETLRYVDLKRATRFEPVPQDTLSGNARQRWQGVAHNELSLRLQPVLPDIRIEDNTITAIDRGEITARSRRAVFIGVLAGWLTCVVMIAVGIVSISKYAGPPTLQMWGGFAACALWLLLLILAWGVWFTRRGVDVTRNTLVIDVAARTATIGWTRTDGDLEASGPLDELALGLYMVEIFEPAVPRRLQMADPMTIGALPMETYNHVDRGWIAIALLGDLWVSLGIDRTPEALRDALQPLRDAGLEIDEDPTITVRGFGVKTLLRPDRERFSRKT